MLVVVCCVLLGAGGGVGRHAALMTGLGVGKYFAFYFDGGVVSCVALVVVLVMLWQFVLVVLLVVLCVGCYSGLCWDTAFSAAEFCAVVGLAVVCEAVVVVVVVVGATVAIAAAVFVGDFVALATDRVAVAAPPFVAFALIARSVV